MAGSTSDSHRISESQELVRSLRYREPSRNERRDCDQPQDDAKDDAITCEQVIGHRNSDEIGKDDRCTPPIAPPSKSDAGDDQSCGSKGCKGDLCKPCARRLHFTEEGIADKEEREGSDDQPFKKRKVRCDSIDPVGGVHEERLLPQPSSSSILDSIS